MTDAHKKVSSDHNLNHESLNLKLSVVVCIPYKCVCDRVAITIIIYLFVVFGYYRANIHVMF